ncbi:MAG: metallophosphoesterase family protein [Candidatus Staskawiczbacteria bacterium]|nr:metallophosphoesterase family protein [Candidatus Staskawiczbacteria bacterium]
MKIAIVSDTHNNWANFQKAIEWIKNENIQLILHCGDISSQEIIDDAKKLFGNDIKFVKGNADWDLDLPESLEVEFNSKKIGFVHFPDIAKKMAQSGKYDMVFYGHTHRAWDERVPSGRGETHMINPGELAGQFYKPTFAVYDTSSGNLELKLLEKL